MWDKYSYTGRRMDEIQQGINATTGSSVDDITPDFEMIRNDLKSSWRSAVRALNAAENSGAIDTACQIKDIVIGLSVCLEFCESMTRTYAK